MKKYISIFLIGILFTGCSFFSENEAITLVKQSISCRDSYLDQYTNEQITNLLATNDGSVNWSVVRNDVAGLCRVQARVKRPGQKPIYWEFSYEVNTATGSVIDDGIFLVSSNTNNRAGTGYPGVKYYLLDLEEWGVEDPIVSFHRLEAEYVEKNSPKPVESKPEVKTENKNYGTSVDPSKLIATEVELKDNVATTDSKEKEVTKNKSSGFDPTTVTVIDLTEESDEKISNHSSLYSQETYNPSCNSNAPEFTIKKITVSESNTTVDLRFYTTNEDYIWSVLSSMYIQESGKASANKYFIKEFVGNELDKSYKNQANTAYDFTWVFEKIPKGLTNIDIQEPELSTGTQWYWKNITINNPSIEESSNKEIEKSYDKLNRYADGQPVLQNKPSVTIYPSTSPEYMLANADAYYEEGVKLYKAEKEWSFILEDCYFYVGDIWMTNEDTRFTTYYVKIWLADSARWGYDVIGDDIMGVIPQLSIDQYKIPTNKILKGNIRGTLIKNTAPALPPYRFAIISAWDLFEYVRE